MTERRREFLDALEAHSHQFKVRLEAETRARLADYFELVERWNARLHLVAPCAPTEFALRHVLESLVALEFIPHGADIVDVGSGAGLPVIPCLITRGDLRAVLFEASAKKCVFLREAAGALHLREATHVAQARFEETVAPEADALTCRALERFSEMLPRLIEWSPQRARLLLFGGQSVREGIERAGLSYVAVHIPLSEQRFLFVAQRRPQARLSVKDEGREIDQNLAPAPD